MATTKNVSHAKTSALPPPKVISEIHLIDLSRIEVRDQARTEFNDESIAELAADIQERGLLQPVLVNPIEDEKYRLICGERRLRALQILGLKSIPAVITKMDDKSAKLTQIAENIQREDMSLKDQAKAIRNLFDEMETLDAVAGMVKKSRAWVSKRVSMTFPNFGAEAWLLLNEGLCKDVEILHIVSQAEKLSIEQAHTLADLVKNENYTREDCRNWIKEQKSANENMPKKAKPVIDPKKIERNIEVRTETIEKAAAIKTAADNAPYDMPKILAMLTSQNKEERELGKFTVREMVKYGGTFPPE